MPENINGLVFNDAVTTAREKVVVLHKQGAAIIIAGCHLGITPNDTIISTQLAAYVPEIALIIDGHSHTELEKGVLIAQADSYENNLGRVIIKIEKGKIISNIDHEKSAQGRFSQISGFRFVYNPSAPI